MSGSAFGSYMVGSHMGHIGDVMDPKAGPATSIAAALVESRSDDDVAAISRRPANVASARIVVT